jgi:arsenate reductase
VLKIYHNNRCSKSRCALDLISHSGQPYEVVDYLKTPPSESELKELLEQLNLKPVQLLRKGETIYKEQFADKTYSDEEWIRIMVQNPILIERPIVVKDGKAIIARPPESLESFL